MRRPGPGVLDPRVTAAHGDHARRAAIVLATFAAAACSGGTQESAGTARTDPTAPEGICALIISTNDLHGRLQPRTYGWSRGREVGGVAVLAAYFDSVRTGESCPVFLLSAGDMMQGTPISNLVQGKSTIAAMAMIGYDAAAVGNHEFDWGIPVLRERIADAGFPFLAANIYDTRSGRHPEWIRPYVLLERGGVRLGVIGLTTESTPFTTKPSHVASLEFRDLSRTIDHYVPEVRRAGADFVVLLLHAGGFCEEMEGEEPQGENAESGDSACEGEVFAELAQTTTRFDYAIAGHTHSLIDTEVRATPVVQAFSSGGAFGLGRLERAADGSVRSEVIDVPTTWADAVTPDRKVAALVDRFRDDVADYAGRWVSTLSTRLEDRRGDFPLGRLIADAQRAATGADVAIMNNGGIRADLGPGSVTYGDLIRVQPFGNTLVRLEVTGRVLLAALDHALEEDGPHANLSGVVVRYVPGAGQRTTAVGRGESGAPRILSVTLESGTHVRPDAMYTIVVNDFMAEGGSGFTMLRHANSAEQTGIRDIDALAEYLRSRPPGARTPSGPRWIRIDGE